MKSRENTSDRSGAALLIVLFIVMAITITAMGFVCQSDVELACGQNMVLHRQMDYLAESGIEHARGLILNPQDTAGAEYWVGSSGLQLTSGNDYYDVAVVRDPNDRCNYTIDCNSYRLNGTQTVGRSSLRAVLRIDPCIAYWVDSNTTVRAQMTINGDVYCGGNLTNSGAINGDAFAAGTITGTSITGKKNASVTPATVAWPNLTIADFGSTYLPIEPNIPPNSNYSAGVYYYVGDVNMPGNVTINGTLVVGGKLTVGGVNNTIVAAKNSPALVVSGQVVMKQGGALAVSGLAQIGQGISIEAPATSASVQVTGGLFIQNSGVASDAVSVTVVAAPEIASIEVWPAGVSRRWEPAAGAFFRSIERIP